MIKIPKDKRVIDKKYTKWIKSLACVASGRPAHDPHHITGYKRLQKGMGTKIDDYFTIPLTREQHSLIHQDREKWERHHGEQMAHCLAHLRKARDLGIISEEIYYKYTKKGFKAWGVGIK